MKVAFTVDRTHAGRTVKQILKNRLGLSERLIKKLKYDRKITLNHAPVHINTHVAEGDVIEAVLHVEEESENVIPEEMELDILFEDESLIALNKPPHMAIHPSCSHPSGTLANGLMHYFLSRGEKSKIRPVSRLDRDTSGIVMFAKNPFVQQQLIQQMKQKLFDKEYIGIVSGHMDKAAGTIDLPIDRMPGSIMLRHVSPFGVPAVTHFEVLETLRHADLLKFKLETGRTHQIRVHCQAIGHPLAGDTFYFNEDSLSLSSHIGRQALHSRRNSFIHPLTGEKLELNAPVPSDITQLLEILRK